MATIGIHYDEFKKKNLNYKGVYIYYGFGNKKKEFYSGDFVKDWYDCNFFIIDELLDSEAGFANSSTVDHFIMDGAPYESAYLKSLDGGKTWELFYEYDHTSEGVEFFVHKGTKPTWAQMKEKYKQVNQPI
jgi:hypothetical protein